MSRIGDDILSRIRSLLLSRHEYRPPRTPWPSEEKPSKCKEDSKIAESYDFNIAKSAAQLVQRDPSSQQLRAKSIRNQSHSPEMSSTSKWKRSATLRGSSSAGDLRGSNMQQEPNGMRWLMGDPMSHHTHPKSFPLLVDDERAQPSQHVTRPTPRLMVPQRRHSHVKSRSAKTANLNFQSKRATLQPTGSVSQTVKNPIDIPLPSESRRDEQHSSGYRKQSRVQEMISEAPYFIEDSNSLPTDTLLDGNGREATGLWLSKSIDIHPPASTSPMAEQCGPPTEETHQNPSSPAMHTIASCSSLRSKVQASSIQSGASKSSAYRHALLKPSIMGSQPIDMGLPVQPVLTRASGTLNLKSETLRTSADGHNHGHPLQTPSAALSNILSHTRPASFDTESHQPDFADNRVEVARPDQGVRTSSTDPTYNARNELIVLEEISQPEVSQAHGHMVKKSISNRMLSDFDLTVVPGNDTEDQTPVILQAIIMNPQAEDAWAANKVLKGSLHNLVPSTTPRDHPGSQVQDADHLKVLKSSNKKGRRKLFLHPSVTQPIISDSREPITAKRSEITGGNELIAVYSAGQTSIAPRSKAITVKHPAVTDGDLAKIKPPEDRQIPKHPSVSLDCSQSKGNIIQLPDHNRRLSQQSHAPATNPGPQYAPVSKGSSSTSQKQIPLRNSSKGDSSRHQSLGKLSGKSDSQLSLNWLRELLSDHETYATRLTAIPPRTHRRANHSPQTGLDPSFLISAAKGAGKSVEPRASETFTRTINDLEILLSEALHIARQAAEAEADADLPDLLHDATAVLQDGRKYIENGTMRKAADRMVISRPTAPAQSSCSHDSPHESARFTSDTMSYGSDGSLDYDQEYYYHTPPRSRRSSADDATKVRVTALPANSTNWPADEGSKLHGSSWIASLASRATTFSRKMSDVKSSGPPAAGNVLTGKNKKHSVISGTPTVPSVRDGNMELVCVPAPTSENRPEAHVEYQQEYERGGAKAASSSHASKPLGKAVITSVVRRQPYVEDDPNRIKTRRLPNEVQNKREVTEFIRVFHQPPIQSRHGSLGLRKAVPADAPPSCVTTSAVDCGPGRTELENHSIRSRRSRSFHCVCSSNDGGSEIDFSTPEAIRNYAGPAGATGSGQRYELRDLNDGVEILPKRHISGRRLHEKLQHLKHDRLSHLNLRGKSHISLREPHGFSLSRSHRRQPIARDWSPSRKRFAASVACISTALVGILIGIYAGEVPSIQYYIADFYHYAILGNVFFFISLAISTFFCWPLPLLHGRKPYTLTAMTIAMPLLFPQAIAVSVQRSPYVPTYRIGLILPRAMMGFALGFANMNFMATLTDLFGASLQSTNPHQETVDENDVRRHGGGLGVWLGIWTWCYMGSIGVGFMIGALVINDLSPDWGFYVSIVIIAAVLFLNVVTPEVRRSAFRRSVTEVKTATQTSRRVARGEVMMHRLQTGPKWWGQEFHQGVLLSLDMMRQPGFLAMSVYVAWMYGQIVLVIVLLGSLMSKYYRFTSPYVGLTTMAIPLGALLAVPFQKASLFSRARHHAQRTDSRTFDQRITITSHLIRRAIFTLVLPFAGLAYTLSSGGPPTPFILPILFAGVIGFLSNLAIAECNGIIMEAFDVSDLQPGMTGRPRGASGERTKDKRTNYSSFPRISSAFAIIQSLGFLIGAAATGVGGVVERQIGQMAATGVMAGILLVLTMAVLGVLYRWKEVQIVPSHRAVDMEKWEMERLMSVKRREAAARQGIVTPEQPELDEPWRPVIIGNPSGKTRRMSILELGHLSRWSEIRRRNRLVDETGYEGRHPNMAILREVKREIRDKNLGSLRRNGSKRSRISQLSQGSEEADTANEDVGEKRRLS